MGKSEVPDPCRCREYGRLQVYVQTWLQQDEAGWVLNFEGEPRSGSRETKIKATRNDETTRRGRATCLELRWCVREHARLQDGEDGI